MGHVFSIDGVEHEAWLSRGPAGYRLHAGNEVIAVTLEPLADGAYRLLLGNQEARVYLASRGDRTFVHLDGESHEVAWSDPLVRLARGHGGALDDIAAAPMPGTVIAVNAKAGDAVRKGQTLMVIESMKLETAISAWRDGIVATVHFAVGQTFERAAALLTLAPDAER
jgi:acetyl/propionyl-CoA carboxylase alpha subunit